MPPPTPTNVQIMDRHDQQQQQSLPTIPEQQQQEEVATSCCACFGFMNMDGTGGQRPQKTYHKKAKHKTPVVQYHESLRTVYHDADDGGDVEALEQLDSLFFFDAATGMHEVHPFPDGHVLAELDSQGDIVDPEDEPPEEYPIITTSSIKPKPRVSMEEPDTLLDHHRLEEEDEAVVPTPGSSSLRHEQSAKTSGMNFLSSIRRMTTSRRQESLEAPTTVVQERGFPGQLTKEELVQAQNLARALQQPENKVADKVVHYFMRCQIEEEPYALCRFLRSVKFDAKAVLARLREFQHFWVEAEKDHFYPSLKTAFDCPSALICQQYPYATLGYAKNGCPVNYFEIGKLNPEGILSIIPIPKFMRYHWHQSAHRFPAIYRKSKQAHPDLVRTEFLIVLDLKGLSAKTLTSNETIEFIKTADAIGKLMPETLHCMIVVNAPMFFAAAWRVLSKFVDPRTAKRIQVFASMPKAKQRLLQLIDASELPSDYGGSNMPLQEAYKVNAAAEAALDGEEEQKKQHESYLISLGKKAKKEQVVDIPSGKRLRGISIYTRSGSSALVSVRDKSDGTEMVAPTKVQGLVEKSPASNGDASTVVVSVPQAFSLPLANPSSTVGPKTLVVELQDQDDCIEKNASRGYFVLHVETEAKE